MQTIKQFLNKLTVEQIWLFFIIIAVATVSIGGAYLLSRNSTQANPSVATEEEKEEILTEIIKNNTKGAITEENTTHNSIVESESGTNNDTSSESSVKNIQESAPENEAPIPKPYVSSTGEAVPLDPSEVVAPDINVYNYRYTKSTVSNGPAVSNCEAQAVSENEATEIYREYFDYDRSFYKTEILNEDGDLYSYYLGKYGSSNNEYFSFIGGKFAVKYLYKISKNFDNGSRLTPSSYNSDTSYPTSYAESNESKIKIDSSVYFGNNAVVLNVYEEDGETYIIVSAGTYLYCGSDNDYASGVRIYKVRESDYQIVEQNTYLDTVSDENLLRTKVFQAEKSKVTFDQVKNEFIFGKESYAKDAGIRLLDYRNYEFNAGERARELTAWLADKNLPFIEVQNADFTLNNIWGKRLPEAVKNQNYLYNRNYYPSDNAGFERYSDFIDESYLRPTLSLLYYTDLPNWGREYFIVEVHRGSIYDDRDQSNADEYENDIYTRVRKNNDDYVLLDDRSVGVDIIRGSETTLPAYLVTKGLKSLLPDSYTGPVSYIMQEPRQYPSYVSTSSYPTSSGTPVSAPVSGGSNNYEPVSYADHGNYSSGYAYISSLPSSYNSQSFSQSLTFELAAKPERSEEDPIWVKYSGSLDIIGNLSYSDIAIKGEYWEYTRQTIADAISDSYYFD